MSIPPIKPTENDRRAPAHHAAHGLFALGLVGDFEFHHFGAGFVHELFDAIPDALVKALVELAAHVEDDGGLEIGSEGRGGEQGGGGRAEDGFQHGSLLEGLALEADFAQAFGQEFFRRHAGPQHDFGAGV